MSFGLCSVAQQLRRLMDKVIPSHLKENVFIYLDDLLIISWEFEEHLKLLKEVAEYLKRANLTIGLNKFENLNIRRSSSTCKFFEAFLYSMRCVRICHRGGVISNK